ncbi:putative aspartate-semialdehyde dehydrogenase [Hyphodiscus hymeniophilus]|uniref:aspartate-semialdehyde dehydrogenase n=1 Tax=Hyphodiscus hymeniophilus TaxID=353542 RepID=A0A9P6VES5_9HELO|nr:putative aspartate-semialdehyde dehydrogenase [Hyphodiscus hymeniophilus]
MHSSSAVPFPRKRCGVLGCTGSVGQRFALLLEAHPYFSLHVVGASHSSCGKTYGDAVKWKQSTPLAAASAELVVKECIPEEFFDCDLVFSGLDDSVAGGIETSFVSAGIPVFSNAKNHRQDPLVPLVVPTANLSHLGLIPAQRAKLKATSIPKSSRNGDGNSDIVDTGMLVCNSNCSVVGVAVPFAALEHAFGKGCIASASITTLQAISGGGYPGVPSMDIMDNIVPFISGEEAKISSEARKILGSISYDETGLASIQEAAVKISATCTRVPVLDGHTAVVSVRFAQRPLPTIEALKEALEGFKPEAQTLGCPSAPKRAIVVMREHDRPQPRLDRGIEGGYAVSVGRLREDESGVWDAMFLFSGQQERRY